MGGNLFKAGRVDKTRYREILDTLKPILDKHFGIHYRIPEPYFNKQTYGDVDILVDAGYLMDKKNWKEKITEELGVTDTKQVRNVFSMFYMNFQVDIFLVGTKSLETSYNFMSYNILGNLIGRIYHKFNLRYGEDGLFYVLRGFNNHISKEIVVCRDIKEILEFVGLSYERWKEGFADLEDIFEYVMSSRYFCSNSYDPKYFNIKKRMSERPDFMAFVDYIDQNGIVKNYPFDSENKDKWLPLIDLYFGSYLTEKKKEHDQKQILAQDVAERFNGKIIMDVIPGIDGKGIGRLIQKIKDNWNDHFDVFVLNSSEETIKEEIKKTYYEQGTQNIGA